MTPKCIGIIFSSENKNYTIIHGIDNHHIDQLIHYTKNDESIRNQTSDIKRFADRNSYDTWSKKRSIYCLLDLENNLKGIIWFGEKPLPTTYHFIQMISPKEYHTTFAIRIYDNARGKKLSQDFMRNAAADYKKSYTNSTPLGLWLETSHTNQAAFRIYQKFGFIQVTNPDPVTHRILMTHLFQ